MLAPADQAAQFVADFDVYLQKRLQNTETPSELLEAMQYSVLGGGKRIRPLLVYAAAAIFSAPRETVFAAAAAVEFIHCYSLIHDDLPAMDDDDLRRGKPTLHKRYDEAMAILAGDALQTLAFEVLADNTLLWPSTEHALKAVTLLAQASGAAGMVGGQVLDIRAEGTYPSSQDVEHMFLLKTGVLIRASAVLGILCAPHASQDDLTVVHGFGNGIGQAFQIQDDILDVIASSEQLGKTQGSDEARDKPNYALRFGLEAARLRTCSLYSQALDKLNIYGENANLLRWLAAYIIQRTK